MLQISQRPLQASAADAELFVNRAAELEKLSRAVRHGFNSMVLGERGVGKTSLLRRFEGQLEDAGTECRFIEASGATTVPELLELVYEAVHGRRRDSTERLRATLAGRDGVADDLRLLAPADGGRLVVLLDSIASPAVVQHLFGRLRDEVWQLPLLWIVAGNRPDRSRYLEPPADSFFDAVIDVGELDEDDAADLLRRRAHRAGQDDPAARVLLSVAGKLAEQVSPRTPRNLLAAARDVLIEAEDDPTRWVTNLYALQGRAAELGRAPAMLFTEVMDLGPVSASDKRLLDRLGWTRPRAAQVFKQLEDAGLVVVTEESPGGPGRPRKLYAGNSMYHAVEDLEAGR
ncbi:MAG: AAA family ATPase [Nocardioidaceae bacterium]